MDSFLQMIYTRHKISGDLQFPATENICRFCKKLFHWMFPEKNGHILNSPELVEDEYVLLQKELQMLLHEMRQHLPQPAEILTTLFFERLPTVFKLLEGDAQALNSGDPAAVNVYEVIRTYPGFHALAYYRLAHELYLLNIPLLPRTITEFAHAHTGIDIHPGASIGSNCCIDHGSGVVVGETTIIGDHVKIYQGVTLGALSVEKSFAKKKRHPTIEDYVILYAGATILGGNTIVGHHSVIGGNVWLTENVPPFSKIYYEAANTHRYQLKNIIE